jgi:hypothetical protein
MFDFAFPVAVALIAPLLGTHYYFKDKIKKEFEKRKGKYAETMGKNQVEGFKALIQRYESSSFPPYDKLEEFYCDLYKKQFEGLDDITEALKLENFLNNTMFFFFSAIALFLLAGVFPYISTSEFTLAGFSVPSMIGGVIATIMACFRIYQIGKIL